MIVTKASSLKPLPEYVNGFRTITCHGYDKKRRVRWATVECKVCKCIYDVDPNKLQYRKHCGCMKSGRIINRYAKEYPKIKGLYDEIRNRCYNKKRLCYNNYGGRGITVCNEWLRDSNIFCDWALKSGYKEGLTIDRINNDEGYSPENCRWVNITEQNRNKRGVKLNMDFAREIRSSNLTYRELQEKYGISSSTVWLVKANKMWVEDKLSGGAN